MALTINFTLPSLTDIGLNPPAVTDFAVMTGAKVLTTIAANDDTNNRVGLVWTQDPGTDASTQSVGGWQDNEIVPQNMAKQTAWVGVAPIINNPGAVGFDVAETKTYGQCLTYRGRLTYYPQRAVDQKLAKTLTKLRNDARLLAIGEYAIPRKGNRWVNNHSICYVYDGNCYVNFVDHLGNDHWYLCEPVRVIAEPEQATIRLCNALFAARYDEPATGWSKRSGFIASLPQFLQSRFGDDLMNSVNCNRYCRERAVKRRQCWFEPRDWKTKLRNFCYTVNDQIHTPDVIVETR